MRMNGKDDGPVGEGGGALLGLVLLEEEVDQAEDRVIEVVGGGGGGGGRGRGLGGWVVGVGGLHKYVHAVAPQLGEEPRQARPAGGWVGGWVVVVVGLVVVGVVLLVFVAWGGGLGVGCVRRQVRGVLWVVVMLMLVLVLVVAWDGWVGGRRKVVGLGGWVEEVGGGELALLLGLWVVVVVRVEGGGRGLEVGVGGGDGGEGRGGGGGRRRGEGWMSKGARGLEGAYGALRAGMRVEKVRVIERLFHAVGQRTEEGGSAATRPPSSFFSSFSSSSLALSGRAELGGVVERQGTAPQPPIIHLHMRVGTQQDRMRVPTQAPRRAKRMARPLRDFAHPPTLFLLPPHRAVLAQTSLEGGKAVRDVGEGRAFAPQALGQGRVRVPHHVRHVEDAFTQHHVEGRGGGEREEGAAGVEEEGQDGAGPASGETGTFQLPLQLGQHGLLHGAFGKGRRGLLLPLLLVLLLSSWRKGGGGREEMALLVLVLVLGEGRHHAPGLGQHVCVHTVRVRALFMEEGLERQAAQFAGRGHVGERGGEGGGGRGGGEGGGGGGGHEAATHHSPMLCALRRLG